MLVASCMITVSPKARRFTQPGIAVNDRIKYHLLEMCFYFLNNLFGKTQTDIEHGQQNAFNIEDSGFSRVCTIFIVLSKFAETFQGKIFALDRDDDRIGCRQRVDGNQAQ